MNKTNVNMIYYEYLAMSWLNGLKCAIDVNEKVIVFIFMQMECPDKGEEWRGFIMTVANVSRVYNVL